jgi:hypothetical protein
VPAGRRDQVLLAAAALLLAADVVEDQDREADRDGDDGHDEDRLERRHAPVVPALSAAANARAIASTREGHCRLGAVVRAHEILAYVVIGGCLLASLLGFVAYRRRVVSGVTVHLLALPQTLLVGQAALGLLLLSGDYRAPDKLHYLYGAVALGVVLSPWFYAPADPRRRLLWFAVSALVAAALGVRGTMTGY